MMTTQVENLTPGVTIGMLDGVVKVERVETKGTSTYVYVSIGRLRGHRVRFETGKEVTVYSVPDDIAPWFGV